MVVRASMTVVAALVLFMSFPRAMASEGQGGGAVPREAMALLLSGPEGFANRSFDLRVGLAPADFPADLLPDGALIGVSAGANGLEAVIAVVTRFSVDDRLAFEQRLESAGWINPLRPAGFAAREGGSSLSLCRGDRFATLGFFPRSEGGSYIRASVVTEPGRACLAQAPKTASPVPLPSMPAPAGARSGRASMGGTPDAMYSSIRLTTRQGAAAIGEHYRNQLISAGWIVEGESGDGAAMSVTRLRASSGAEAPLTALLVVTTVGGSSEVDVLLRLVQPQGLPDARH